jgi:hypothetical protein
MNDLALKRRFPMFCRIALYQSDLVFQKEYAIFIRIGIYFITAISYVDGLLSFQPTILIVLCMKRYDGPYSSTIEVEYSQPNCVPSRP